MFTVGEKVVYKHNAVCVIESVETPAFAASEGKEYYKLRYCYSKNSETVYVPCENSFCIRPVSDKKYFDECCECLKTESLPAFSARQPAVISSHYQQILSDYTLKTSLLVYKELLSREKELEANGKKLRQVEGHYLGIVERAVCEEFAVCVGTEYEDAKQKLSVIIL